MTTKSDTEGETGGQSKINYPSTGAVYYTIGGFKLLVDYEVHESGVVELTLWDDENHEEYVEFQDWEDIEHIVPPEEDRASMEDKGVTVQFDHDKIARDPGQLWHDFEIQGEWMTLIRPGFEQTVRKEAIRSVSINYYPDE